MPVTRAEMICAAVFNSCPRPSPLIKLVIPSTMFCAAPVKSKDVTASSSWDIRPCTASNSTGTTDPSEPRRDGKIFAKDDSRDVPPVTRAGSSVSINFGSC